MHPLVPSPQSCQPFQPEVWAPLVQQSPQSQHVLPLLDAGNEIKETDGLKYDKTKIRQNLCTFFVKEVLKMGVIHRHAISYTQTLSYSQFMLICWLSSISSISVGMYPIVLMQFPRSLQPINPSLSLSNSLNASRNSESRGCTLSYEHTENTVFRNQTEVWRKDFHWQT